MKVRFYRKSIRFRLADEEVEALMAAGSVQEQLLLPDGSTFTMVLALSAEVKDARVYTAESGVKVLINKEAAMTWGSSEVLSLRFNLQVAGSPRASTLNILVEKDLPCQSH